VLVDLLVDNFKGVGGYGIVLGVLVDK